MTARQTSAIIAASRSRGELQPRPLDRADKRALQSPLTSVFPEGRTLNFGFTQLAVINPSIPTGAAAWFGLRSYTAEQGQEISFHGFRIHASPPDVDGVGYAGMVTAPLAWGTEFCTGAALCIGINLPCAYGVWTAAPCAHPQIDGPQALPNAQAPNVGVEDRWYFPLPAGKISATGQYATTIQNQTPLSWRIPQGARLDVALIVRGSYVHGVSGYLCGNVQGTLIVAPASNQYGMTS